MTAFQPPGSASKTDPLVMARKNLAVVANIPPSGYGTRYSSPDSLLAIFQCIYSNAFPSSFPNLNNLLSSYARMRLGFYADDSHAVQSVSVGEEDTSYMYGRNLNPEANLLERQKKWILTLAWSAREASVVPVQRGAEFFVEDAAYTADYLLALSHEWRSYANGESGIPQINVTQATLTSTWFKRSDDDTIYRITGHKSHAFILTNSKWRLGGEGYPGTEPLGADGIIYGQIPLVKFLGKPPAFIHEYSHRRVPPENQLYVTSVWDAPSQVWKLLGVFLAPEDLFLYLDSPWKPDPYLADDEFLKPKVAKDSRRNSNAPPNLPVFSPGLGITADDRSPMASPGFIPLQPQAQAPMPLQPTLQPTQKQMPPQPQFPQGLGFGELPQINIIEPTPNTSIIITPGGLGTNTSKPKANDKKGGAFGQIEHDSSDTDPDYQLDDTAEIMKLHGKLEKIAIAENGELREDIDADEMTYYDMYDKAGFEDDYNNAFDKPGKHHEKGHHQHPRKAMIRTITDEEFMDDEYDYNDDNDDDDYYKGYDEVETALNGDFSKEKLEMLSNNFRLLHGGNPAPAQHLETEIIAPGSAGATPPSQAPGPPLAAIPTGPGNLAPIHEVSSSMEEDDSHHHKHKNGARILAEMPGGFPLGFANPPPPGPKVPAATGKQGAGPKSPNPKLKLGGPMSSSTPVKPVFGAEITSQQPPTAKQKGKEVSTKHKLHRDAGASSGSAADNAKTSSSGRSEKTASSSSSSHHKHSKHSTHAEPPALSGPQKQMIESHLKTTIGSLYQVAKSQGIALTEFLALALEAASEVEKK